MSALQGAAASSPRVALGVFRVVMLQAFWISFGYLGVGIAVEGLRRLTGSEFWEHASEFVDALALTLLRRSGLIDRLIAAAAHKAVSPFAVRVLLSTTTVVAIFLQAASLALVFSFAARLLRTRVSS